MVKLGYADAVKHQQKLVAAGYSVLVEEIWNKSEVKFDENGVIFVWSRKLRRWIEIGVSV